MPSNLEAIRHSLSHLMAMAVLKIFPDAKLGIGPTIADGFYYDFELDRPLIPQDLREISKIMHLLILEHLDFVQEFKSPKEAKKIMAQQPYKLELIDKLIKAKEKLSFYRSGDFLDLCVGPHVKNSKEINPEAFKLTYVAGAYWRGSEKNKMLQRIYGLAFANKKELDDHLLKMALIEKRDHRKIGQEQNLFSLSEEVGGGLVIWHPAGAIIRNTIENFWKEEHQKRGYQYVYSPHIGNLGLWKKSGHWEFYRENIYSPMEIDKNLFLIKPMNCPYHVQIYKTQMRSYRDLPLKYCELGTVYRYERAGVLHGLLRVRGFTQDDAHIFCRADQLEEELTQVMKFALFMLKTFGYREFAVDLSVRDPKNKKKYLGSDAIWNKAEKALETALKKVKLKYQRAEGEAVFYGPKADIKLIDSLGRSWQGPTIQVDFNFPEKFDLTYVDEKGKKARVVMIHRTVLGSMERFVGCLLEHYGGALPLWLSPMQVAILSVGKAHRRFCEKLNKEFQEQNIRTYLNNANQTVGYKIREAEKQKIPYMLVIGDKEMKAKTLTVRQRGQTKLLKIPVTKFLKELKKKIDKKV